MVSGFINNVLYSQFDIWAFNKSHAKYKFFKQQFWASVNANQQEYQTED